MGEAAGWRWAVEKTCRMPVQKFLFRRGFVVLMEQMIAQKFCEGKAVLSRVKRIPSPPFLPIRKLPDLHMVQAYGIQTFTKGRGERLGRQELDRLEQMGFNSLRS